MAIKNFNQPPYYDDWSEAKNYLRTLFRPGYSVQARELTQLQTALQNQVSKVGDHLFTDGSKILEADHTLDLNVDYITLDSSYNSLNVDNYYDEFEGTVITGQTSGVKAKVIKAIPAENTDPITLFVAYIDGGNNNTSKTFDYEEVVTSDASTPRASTIKPAVENSIGKGSRLLIGSGVFYVNGSFVYVEQQDVVISKYSSTPSARVVLEITENLITSADDSSLVDNAAGSPNASAPGAHRYNIELTLAVEPYDLSERSIDNYIPIVVINNGVLEETSSDTQYAEILKLLATRTYEESGNYTVRPFPIQIRDHVDGDADKLSIALEPSVAYIEGNRVETISSTYIDLDRSRDESLDVASFSRTSSFADLGNYVTVNNLSGVPDINTFNTINLVNASASVIGTARVRYLQDVGSSQYRVYLFDIQMNAGQSRGDIASMNATNVTPNFSADLVVTGPSYIEDSGNNVAIFPLPYEGAKSVIEDSVVITTCEVRSATISTNKLQLATGTDNILFTDLDDIVIVLSSGSNAGDVIPLTGLTVEATGATSALTNLSITGPAITAANGETVKVLANTIKSNSGTVRKTKNLIANEEVTVTSPNTTNGGYDDLGLADIYQIKAIYMSPDLSTPATTSHKDVTARYDLDNGQRDNFYDNGRIRLKRDAAAPIGRLLVVLDYFEHTSGDFFTVDSYSVDWSDIPEYASAKGTYNLRNVIDCRPRKDQTGSGFTGLGSSVVEAIVPDSVIFIDMDIYLPRKDKVYVKSNGEFGVKRGVSAINPSYPADADNSMTLYLLDIAPYTGKTTDVRPTFVENKRYTMRDIGKIEDRVKKLEYYTTLSLLEKDVMASSTLANDGTDRFRNGFVVDGFYGHNVGDVSNADYKVSMDLRKGQLRPSFFQDSVKLKLESSLSDSGISNGEIITLPILSHKKVINQPYASGTENLNPYLVFKYEGQLTLDPEVDDWMDVEERPDVVLNLDGLYDAIEFLADETGVTGTHWNWWETDWSSTSVNVSTSGIATTTTTTTTTQQTKTGEEITLSSSPMTAAINDIVVDMNIVPFIRARRVYFYASRLKPNTKLWMFMDDTDISGYARSTTADETFEEWSAGASDPEIYKSETAHPEGANTLTTNADGEIWGSFIIPSNDAVKFRTGSRVVRLIDSSSNNIGESSTSAERIYTASGVSKSTVDFAVNAKIPTFETAEISDTRTLISRTSRTVWNTGNGSSDPLAQSFSVTEDGGAFITKIDTYFKSKSDIDPVSCQIRTMSNGYPTTEIIAQASLRPNDVNTSTDASVATTFEFPWPVYLNPGVEYAFVLKSNSVDYNAWVSELGQFDVTDSNVRITEQPATGVLFKSANESTWTPDQFKDIKFSLYRAVFDTSTTYNAVFTNGTIPAKLLQRDPFITYNGSSEVRVLHKNHGIPEGGKVTITGAAEVGDEVNGIPIAQFNATHVISNVEFDSYTIAVSSNADANGSGGGTAVKATEDKRIDVFKTNVAQIVLPGTDLAYSYKISSGKTLGGNDNAYSMSVPYKPFLSGTNIYPSSTLLIPGPANGASVTGSESEAIDSGLFIKAILSSTKDNLTPVIDPQRNSIISIYNRVDNAVEEADHNTDLNNPIAKDPNGNVRFVDETSAKDNSGACRYITRKVLLDDDATDLRMWLKVNRPADTYIDVYYRLNENDNELLDDQEWELATPLKEAPQNDDPRIYSEIEYDMEDIGTFSGFQVKIVLRSHNSTKVPTVKDFRAIALS